MSPNRLTDEQIIERLNRMRQCYHRGWTPHDLQDDLEELFMELEQRELKRAHDEVARLKRDQK